MPRKVRAKVGDSLCNIAFQNGFGDCKPLREDPANAFIVNRANDPGQVLPGDMVTVPDFIEHSESKGTEAKHKFVKRDNFALLRFVHGSKDSSVRDDRTLSFLNVSNYVTNLAGAPDGETAKPFPGTGVRNFNDDADKDIDAFKVEVLDIDATADLTVELEVLRPTYNAAGTVTGHTRFPAGAIRTPRTLTAQASKQGATQRFRTCYLRLVVDDADKAAATNQTLLASDMFDPADPTTKQVEILDQVVKASYTITKCPQNPKCKSTVILPIGTDRRRIKLAVHVLRRTAGGALVVPLDQAEGRVWTWFRRVFAQSSIGPKLMQAVRGVDPPENLVSISDGTGNRAAGDGQLSFRINAAGRIPQVISITPPAGATPLSTANALAAKIKTPFRAAVTSNPPIFGSVRRSADIVITETGGTRVTIDQEITGDSNQSLTVGRVAADPVTGLLTLLSWDGTNWLAGSIQQRTVLKNHDTGDDRVDVFVVDTLSAGNGGEAMMSGHRVDPARRAISQVKWSAFIIQSMMDNSNADPFAFPHEVGHVVGEVVHTDDVENFQLMNQNYLGSPSAVGLRKRIRDAAAIYTLPAGNFNLVDRLRSEGRPVMENW